MPITLQDTLLIVSLAGVLQWLIAEWLKARLQASLRHEYDKKLESIKSDFSKALEDYRTEIRRREQAAKVAEVLANEFSEDDASRSFNKLAWEIVLSMPPEVVERFAKCIQTGGLEVNPKDLIVQLRGVFLGKTDSIDKSSVMNKGSLRIK
jgi:hypothetical protein